MAVIAIVSLFVMGLSLLAYSRANGRLAELAGLARPGESSRFWSGVPTEHESEQLDEWISRTRFGQGESEPIRHAMRARKLCATYAYLSLAVFIVTTIAAGI